MWSPIIKRIDFNLDNEHFVVWNIPGPNKKSPVIHWAHANGFNGLSYHKFLKGLSKYCHVYAWDARGHGQTTASAQISKKLFSLVYAKDLSLLFTKLSKLHQSPIIAGGHSFGGSISILAANQVNEVVSTIVLADPLIFTPFYSFLSNLGRVLHTQKVKNLYLADNALRRKKIWDNANELLDSYSKKAFFKDWDMSSIEKYIEAGTRRVGTKVELTCDPTTEAEIFKQGERTFILKDIMKFRIPFFLYLAEKNSPTFGKRAFTRTKIRTRWRTIANTTHFFPIEEADSFSILLCDDLLAEGLIEASPYSR